MSISSPPDDDGRALGQVLLSVGFVVLSLGLALCGYAVVAGGFESSDYGGGSDLDTTLMVVGVIALVIGTLVLATAALFVNAVRRPPGHRTYGAYPEVDDDDDGW